ncbi:uncharacterized protein TrAFT101_011919 [Trichoderma asperellum]|uniref:Zn(2)-C6 fungal-type domain-containing protein n=1 Tax=Trichoderma asperellum (strain ATCC 204424 / CBS 433.97 / NBRC 101777) TaxID=1042311 RepID=A0A2T3YZJ0_TRIA4|nr:hypothetical protein M441DRAFT_60296 [Trichoderma asperellum CBS 433.97]PTB37973.1 hypothetical protein M441DRAFT_60296 [Trichoderma asperellum CBS 433.97]UKZ97152.1 hypothetical protein TrAFT101_011919 [Trichoderma asperellum]
MDSGLVHKRRRLAPACIECQRRKIRCDSATPCGPCSKLSNTRCIYSNVHFHPFPNGDFRSPNDTRLDISQLPNIQSNKQHPLFQDGNSGRLDLFSLEPTTAHFRDDVGANLANYLGLDDTHSRIATSHSTRVSYPDASASTFSDASTAVSRQLSTPSDDHASWSSANSIFDPEPQQNPSGATHGRIATCWEEAMNKCERLQFVLYGLRNKRGPIQLQSKHEPLRPLMDRFVKLERQARASKNSAPNLSLNWTATPELPNYAVKKLLPPQRICDILLDAYLATFESVWRILHVPTFLRDYRRFWAGSSSIWSPDIEELFLCKLVICIALGAFVNPELDTADNTVSEQNQDGIYWREQAKTWIAYGRQWLARKAIAGSRADLNTAQIICLLALSRYTGPVNATSTGSLWSPGDHDLTRLAIQLGLHRDPTKVDPDMPATEIEVRRRLWATMLELSLQLCLDHELPAPISPETYDCAPPSDLADEDASTSDADSTLSSYFTSYSPGYRMTRTNLLVVLTRTQRLRLRILHIMHSPGAAKALEDTHRLAAELKGAYSTELRRLRSLQKKPTEFQIKLLDALTLPFVLAPHAKFAAHPLPSPACYFSRKVRMEISALLLTNHSSDLATVTQTPAAGLEEVTADADGLPVLPSNTTSSAATTAATSSSASYPANPLTVLRIHGQGHFATLQWHAILALCLDLISELKEEFFSAVSGPSWRQLQGTIQTYVTMLEQRVRTSGGATSAREFLFCSCAAAYIETMLGGDGEADQAITSAAYAALTLCCEIMEQGLQPRRGIV